MDGAFRTGDPSPHQRVSRTSARAGEMSRELMKMLLDGSLGEEEMEIKTEKQIHSHFPRPPHQCIGQHSENVLRTWKGRICFWPGKWICALARSTTDVC